MENQNLGESQIEKVQTIYAHILVTRCGRVFTTDRIKHSFSRGRSPYSCKILGRELKLRKDKDGYLRFNSVIEGKHQTILVHRLMAETFLGARPNNFVVDHIDRNNTNNKIENLRYASCVDNVKNSARHKMTQDKKDLAIKMKKIGMSVAAISRALNVQYGSVAYFFKSLVDCPHFERNV
tara:strand:+ start:111 stop:650 length:540 start_codon:yes stop_codon:yes gene_type:complete